MAVYRDLRIGHASALRPKRSEVWRHEVRLRWNSGVGTNYRSAQRPRPALSLYALEEREPQRDSVRLVSQRDVVKSCSSRFVPA